MLLQKVVMESKALQLVETPHQFIQIEKFLELYSIQKLMSVWQFNLKTNKKFGVATYKFFDNIFWILHHCKW